MDKKTFHDQVLRAYTDNGDGADPLSPELLLLFRDLTDETFDQLKGTSFFLSCFFFFFFFWFIFFAFLPFILC